MSHLYVSRHGKPPLRFTRLGQYVLIALAGLCVAGLVAAILVGTFSVVRTIQQECTVAVGEQEVGLSSEEAERAATVVARVIREGGDQAAARGEVRRVVEDLSAQDAVPIAMALAGRHQAALSCDHGGGPDEADGLLGSGLTERAEAVRLDLRRAWPRTPLGGFAPGGVSNGHMAGSAHYEGRAIDAFFRPVNDNNLRLGWAMAQYYVAHADRLHLETVIFDDRIWTARRAGEGWRDYRVDTAGKSRSVAQVLEHRDHVHVDVAD